MEYGDRLKLLRENMGLSQKELTDRLSLNRSTYARYETNSTQPDFETLKKLADFFNVSTDYILGRSHTPESTPLNNDEDEFQTFINNPELNVFYKELPKSDEEAVKRLRDIWEIIKKDFKK